VPVVRRPYVSCYVLQRRAAPSRGRAGRAAPSQQCRPRPASIIASAAPIYAGHSVPGGSSSLSPPCPSGLSACAGVTAVSDPLISGLASPRSAPPLPDPAIGGAPASLSPPASAADPATPQALRRLPDRPPDDLDPGISSLLSPSLSPQLPSSRWRPRGVRSACPPRALVGFLLSLVSSMA
jgi:hypothetical protein